MQNSLSAFPWKIHPYSILVAIGLDLLWNFVEVGFLASFVGVFGYPCLVILIFLTCAWSVSAIQRNYDYDESNVAWTKGILLGVFAAIPLSFTTLFLGAGYKLIQLIVGGDKIWLTGLLTTNWAKLEGMLRNKAKNLGMNGGQATMEEVINFLGNHHAISPSDVNELHRLRVDRNSIAHVGQANNIWSSARRSESILRKYQKRF